MHILQIAVNDKDLNKCYPIDNTSIGPERMGDHQAIVPPCASLFVRTELALLDDRLTSVFLVCLDSFSGLAGGPLYSWIFKPILL